MGYAVRIISLLVILLAWSWEGLAQQTNLDQLEFAANVKGTKSLTAKEVVQVFRNGRSLWPSGEKVVIVLPANKSDIAESVAKNLYGGSVTAMQKFWLALVFQGRANPPVFLQSAEEIIAYISKNPGAIGVIPKGAAEIPQSIQFTVR
jgi:ABC-type phosphate transport system substrate-binding protein